MDIAFYFKLYIFILLILIVVSLFSGLFFLAKDNSSSKRLVTSLTFRIVLSVILFLSLFAGYKFGWIVPHGLGQ